MKKQSKLTKGEKSNITRWYHDGLSVLQISERLDVTVTCVKGRIRKIVKADCDRLWSKIIRKDGFCAIHGRNCTEGLNSHHLLEKGAFPQFRYELNNGICICTGIHSYHPELSPHYSSHSRKGFWDWMKENRLEQWEWWDENRHNKKYVEMDIFKIHEELKGQVTDGNGNNTINT